MDTLIDYLVEARNAHLRNDWRASYTAFVGADGLGPMSTDDLEAYSAASWRAGHGSEATRLAERAFDRLVRTDQAAAAMKAAVLALQWHARRHDSVSRVWADRARGLLAGSPSGGTHGYLAYLDATTALEAGDTATAVRCLGCIARCRIDDRRRHVGGARACGRRHDRPHGITRRRGVSASR